MSPTTRHSAGTRPRRSSAALSSLFRRLAGRLPGAGRVSAVHTAACAAQFREIATPRGPLRRLRLTNEHRPGRRQIADLTRCDVSRAVAGDWTVSPATWRAELVSRAAHRPEHDATPGEMYLPTLRVGLDVRA